MHIQTFTQIVTSTHIGVQLLYHELEARLVLHSLLQRCCSLLAQIIVASVEMCERGAVTQPRRESLCPVGSETVV